MLPLPARRSRLAFADIKDYKFQLVDQTVQAGADRVVAVRLVNKKTGKPVPDAVIFATRLDMAPDGMQEMVTKVTPMPGAEPGTYKFKATFGMAGRWQLSLGRKGAGRNRHRRKQARHHGAEMNRALLNGTVAVALIAAAGAAFVAAVLALRGGRADRHVRDRRLPQPPARRSTTRIPTASRSTR